VVRSFKEEQVEELERMGVAFRSRPVRNAAARQVQLLMDFLKVRFFPSFFLLFMKETDIGRYVNGLRKHPLGRSQEAGEVAHQFERKWKEVMDGWVRLHNSVGDGGSSIAVSLKLSFQSIHKRLKHFMYICREGREQEQQDLNLFRKL